MGCSSEAMSCTYMSSRTLSGKGKKEGKSPPTGFAVGGRFE